MSGIIEFLEARIAEDEAAARDFEHEIALALNGSYSNWELHYGAPADWRAVERIGYPPARVLAECAAKRAIIDAHPTQIYLGIKGEAVMECLICERSPCDTLSALAAVYASHPDYRQEWVI